MSESNHKENHLKGQTSPYLLQHLYNPVDWYPWGPEALTKAVSENKPLLVSIGYSACHWCHVMERESFEDHEVAKIMNDHFVCIKVDREERPDIDHLYMNAVQLISGQGGWPLNCFALPDGKPFWGATYFPKEQWKNILLRIHELFSHQYDEVKAQAEDLTNGILKSSILEESVSPANHFPEEATHKMAQSIINNTDMEEGGTTGAPKFPLPAIYEFLLHYHYQNPDNPLPMQAIHTTLTKMAQGGIYDQIGGGFSRYSVDEHWKVPHFEKMLYDNAQLIALYSKAWKVNQYSLYKTVVVETIAFVQRELRSSNHTFYAALDADSEGVEGKYYVWSKKEIYDVLGEDAPLAIEYFNVGGKGFWEKGINILVLDQSDEEFAKELNLEPENLKRKISDWKQLLLAAREKRVRPGLDNKVLISWNALMIDALAEAGSAFSSTTWIQDAEKTAQFILHSAMEDDGKLYHILNDNHPAIDGFLEDYACMIKALIKLGQVAHKEEYFLLAKKLLEYTLQHFSTQNTNMFSFSSSKGEKLVAPYTDFQDNVIPSSNSIMARNLFYLGNIFEKAEWVDKSKMMLNDMASQIEKYGRWVANWGVLWLHQQKNFYTLAICGDQAAEKSNSLLSQYLPDTLLCSTTQPGTKIPVLENRFTDGETLIYPCTLLACQQPVKEPEEVLSFMKRD
jgi:uncharacterized protein